jgi:hypothetical protein
MPLIFFAKVRNREDRRGVESSLPAKSPSAPPEENLLFQVGGPSPSLGPFPGKDGAMATVWVYVDTTKQVGERDHLKLFSDAIVSHILS